jgi:hypothetical protein
MKVVCIRNNDWERTLTIVKKYKVHFSSSEYIELDCGTFVFLCNLPNDFFISDSENIQLERDKKLKELGI